MGDALMTTTAFLQDTLKLTAHPLQRAGAYAIATLAKVSHPETITGDQFRAVVQRMIGDLITTSTIAKGQPGWYLLGVSYVLWPNCALHYKSKRTREGITAWRTCPPAEKWPGVPCTLCGRPAAAWYGKGDIPLGASIEHRNTTAPDHEGTPLCFPCVTSFHALPYACTAGGGLLNGIHTWDERFMARITRSEVRDNLQGMITRGDLKGGGGTFAIEFAALKALRWWDHRVTAGVQTLQFSNNNQDQKFQSEVIEQPLAEWLRSTVRSTDRRTGFRYLAQAQATAKVSGLRMLAWRAFNQPEQIPSRAIGWMRDQILNPPKHAAPGSIPASVPHLAPLIRSYLTEVLHVLESDVAHVVAVARRVADVVADDDKRLKKFTVATRRPNDLKAWLKAEIADWSRKRPADAENDSFISVRQWRVLFDSGNASWSARELLFVATFEELATRGAKVAAVEEGTSDEDFKTLDTDDQD
ncbi:hypothetical protein AB0I10_22015 [Streptomyces sp. NPDC050636]|uniref:hypothetical protein n=1 Tax=Streptomyces sp. NPDC050636 TaxID=3154510 RepID=UPI00341F2F59